MDSSPPLAFHPALLSPGTVVGTWRVEAWAGRGVYGAVYRALPLQDEHASPVALKLAMHPADPRFAREVELLSRCHHPSIPRLVDHGSWQSPAGTLHPFLVMQWVDGVPLYEQARLRPLSAREVRRWLAQLARALGVLHAQGAVHRDVKGDNVLVRRSDGRAMLMDFGTCLYPGAATLTPPLSLPGTPAYLSPESWLFELQFSRDLTARYPASPADDLYALGVTACRLISGEYPKLAAPSRDEHGTWHPATVLPPPTLLSGLQGEPSLRALILRLLSVHPEQRGTAAELAEALEQTCVAVQAPPPVPLPLAKSTETPAPAPPLSVALHEELEPITQREWRWFALAAASLALAIWTWAGAPGEPLGEPSLGRGEPSEVAAPVAGACGLAEEAAVTSTEQASSPSPQEAIAEEAPQPLPGQLQPDEKGRCPHKGLVPLNNGCWEKTAWDPEKCLGLGGQMFKGTCYVPFVPRGSKRPPTSSPMDKP